MTLDTRDPLAIAVVTAIRSGDVEALRTLLGRHPDLATARITDTEARGGPVTRTLLHVATDWPGHFPNVEATIKTLLDAGADVDARFTGAHAETPLHWAASSNDVHVLDLLLDRGADIEAAGGVIGGGTPLADAVAFRNWEAARRLVQRGARTTLWQAAALGLVDRVDAMLRATPPPERGEITKGFWCACHGGQRAAAERLLAHGADLNWVGFDGLTPLDAANRSGAVALAAWLREHGARSAAEASER
jgi:hypothetical protein